MSFSAPTVARVRVPVSPVWASPTSPRPVDAPAVTDDCDHAGWLAAMDAAPGPERGRIGLEERLETEALAGEPVLVHEQTRSGWCLVTCPWQPSHKDARGYPGYMRTAHLSTSTADYPTRPPAERAGSVGEFLAQARRHLGLAYLWGGNSPAGLDCSGLVHASARMLGVVVPRDADDQRTACEDVPLGAERPGDLYFFAHPGATIHHVGIVTGPRVMLHAPMTGQGVTEEPMPTGRGSTLVAAGRIGELH